MIRAGVRSRHFATAYQLPFLSGSNVGHSPLDIFLPRTGNGVQRREYSGQIVQRVVQTLRVSIKVHIAASPRDYTSLEARTLAHNWRFVYGES